MKSTKIWAVFYDDGTYDGPAILWGLYSTAELAEEACVRMNRGLRSSIWVPATCSFIWESWELDPPDGKML